MSNPSAERPPIRIGTAERQAAFAALSAHLDAGRLDPDEYGERYARISVARTQPELEALFIDLPAPHPAFPDAAPDPMAPSWARGGPAGSRGRPAVGRGRFAPVLFALIPLAAVALAVTTGLWFLIFFIPASFALFGGRRRGFCGPGWGGAGWGGPRYRR